MHIKNSGIWNVLCFHKFADWKILPALALLTAATACGGGGNSQNTTNGGPTLAGNTSVSVVLTSTANDQLTTFGMQLLTITLTNQAGKTINLLSAQQPFESIHLNGGIEPFFTASIPQDVYTSASATIGTAYFVCNTLVPAGQPNTGGLASGTFGYGATPNANVTVKLPTPLLVSGKNETLLLNFDVSKSETFSSCFNTGTASYAITPTFNLTSVVFSAQPTNAGNGKFIALEGTVTTVDDANNVFTFSMPDGSEGTRTLRVKFDGNTAFQGISDFASFSSSMFAEIDGTIASDGSLLATRIAVEDSSAVNVIAGPVLQTSIGSTPEIQTYGILEQGPLLNQSGYLGITSLKVDSTVFQVSRQFTNLQDLPFVPTFTAANIVPGQNVYVGTPTIQSFPITANTITLVPQTINGTVVAATTSGSFNVYTVTLAPYDLFTALATQPGQTSLLTNANEVEVYIDSNTQFTNGQTVALGTTLRFGGLVFNDNGTLRMDCNQVNNGVAK
jgi:hypothetical protein